MLSTHFKRAHALPSVAAFVADNGGDIDRVFRAAELPLTLIEHPEEPILLGDYCRVLELAARSLEDDLTIARSAIASRTGAWGAFGRWITAAPTLREAIRRTLNDLDRLQTGGAMALDVRGRVAIWSYRLDAPAGDGAWHDALLTLLAMRQVVRAYASADWQPVRLTLAATAPEGGDKPEAILGCPLEPGQDANALVFNASLLDTPGLRRPADGAEAPPPLPRGEDLIGVVGHLCRLCLLEQRPSLAWTARKLGANDRTLQRHLRSRGVAFSDIMDATLRRSAEEMLLQTSEPIAHVAARLGYADPSHFTRAWKRWTGESPRAFRRSARTGKGGSGRADAVLATLGASLPMQLAVGYLAGLSAMS